MVVYTLKKWLCLQTYQALATQARIELIGDAWMMGATRVPEMDQLSFLIARFADYDHWTDAKLGDAIGVGIRYRDSQFVRMLGNEFYEPGFYQDDEEFVALYNAYHARRAPPALRLVKG